MRGENRGLITIGKGKATSENQNSSQRLCVTRYTDPASEWAAVFILINDGSALLLLK